MKFYCIAFLLCTLNAPSLRAQFILNQDGEAFGNIPFFNSELIAAQHIQTIGGFYTYKKANAAFVASADRFSYRFNTLGQLIASLQIIQKDTTFHHYAYHPNQQLSMHRFAAYGGALCEHYTYDSLQRITSVTLYRDNYNHQKDTLLSSIKMRTETLRYHGGQVADYTRFNNYQRPYLEVSKTFDSTQLLRSSSSYFRISQTNETTKYTYNQTGLLAGKATFIDSLTNAKEEWRYRYDQWGNLIEMHQYENGTFVYNYQIVYDYKTGFLGSLIKKEQQTDNMRILRFTDYTYYPKP